MGNIAKRTGCKMLLAQKAFSNYDCYHLLKPYLTGTEASGLYEAAMRGATNFSSNHSRQAWCPGDARKRGTCILRRIS